LGIPADAIVAGFHQRNDENIFSPLPLQAFAKIQQSNFHFIIWASPLYRKQANKLKIKNMHFLEKPSTEANISQFLNSLDIFAHGRRDGETFGTVLAEAMIHGLPCLSHSSLVGNNNAQPETMGPSGLFAHNLDEYTEMLDDLFKNEALRKKLSAKAKIHAEQYYSVSACVQKVSLTYQKLAGMTIDNENSLSELEYGYSHLGYLQAGDLENPASISNHILVGGTPEQFEVEVTQKLLPKVKTFIDIGANIGLYCLVAAAECLPSGKVYAFEPQPDCYKALIKTVWLNNWEDRVFVHQLGLGNIPGELNLHLAGTGSSFDNAFNDNKDLPIIRVPVDTLDHQIELNKIEVVDFIKIDVEGFEQNVLEGGENVINRDKPILFIEIADKVENRSYRNINYAKTLTWLLDHGYHIWRCSESGKLQKANPKKPQNHLAMYLCLPNSFKKTDLFLLKIWAKNRYIKKVVNRKLTRLHRVINLNRLIRAIKNPVFALRWLWARLSRNFGSSKNNLLISQTETSSYEKHHQDFINNIDLEGHKILFNKFENENQFNNPEMKIADLLTKYPLVRDLAVDIGCGAGWLSAKLHDVGFNEIIGIEPSSIGLEYARQIYDAENYPNIKWINGFAENELPLLNIQKPTLFVTGCVLAHLTDDAVVQICAAINTIAPKGSILSLAEPWGPESHEFMWHVRTKQWWQNQLPQWNLDFHGPSIQEVSGRHKGFHGLKIK